MRSGSTPCRRSGRAATSSRRRTPWRATSGRSTRRSCRTGATSRPGATPARSTRRTVPTGSGRSCSPPTIGRRQRTLRGSALIGAAWGLGHTITVFLVGSAIVLFGVVIPARVGLAMEFAVGIMLVLLGLMTLTGLGRAARGAAASFAGGGVARQAHSQGHDRISHDLLHDHAHAHAHGDYVHQHAHGHGAGEHGHRDDQTPLARIDGRLGGFSVYHYLRPLVVGIVHGLAGSAAVALLV